MFVFLLLLASDILKHRVERKDNKGRRRNKEKIGRLIKAPPLKQSRGLTLTVGLQQQRTLHILFL